MLITSKKASLFSKNWFLFHFGADYFNYKKFESLNWEYNYLNLQFIWNKVAQTKYKFILLHRGNFFLNLTKKKLWLCKCYKLTATSSEDRNPSISPHNFLKAWHIIRKFCFHLGSETLLPPLRVSCSSGLFFIGRSNSSYCTGNIIYLVVISLVSQWCDFFIILCETPISCVSTQPSTLNWPEIHTHCNCGWHDLKEDHICS